MWFLTFTYPSDDNKLGSFMKWFGAPQFLKNEESVHNKSILRQECISATAHTPHIASGLEYDFCKFVLILNNKLPEGVEQISIIMLA